MIRYEADRIYVNDRVLDFSCMRPFEYYYEKIKNCIEDGLLDERCLEYVIDVYEKENEKVLCIGLLYTLCDVLKGNVKSYLCLLKEKNIPYMLMYHLYPFRSNKTGLGIINIISAFYYVFSILKIKNIKDNCCNFSNVTKKVLGILEIDTVNEKIIKHKKYVSIIGELLFGCQKSQNSIYKIIKRYMGKVMKDRDISLYDLLAEYYIGCKLSSYSKGDMFALLLIHLYGKRNYHYLTCLYGKNINLESIRDIVLSGNDNDIKNMIELVALL